MDAVIAYLTLRLKHTFTSNPPSSALILWWPSNSPNQQKAFVTRQIGEVPQALESQILKTLGAPLVLYSYDSDLDLLQFKLKGKTLKGSWNDHTLEHEVAMELGIPYQTGGTKKPPNNPQQVRDLFHIWSRKAFAGIRKTDIDLLLLNDKEKMRALVEVKRSAKVPVGVWTPYPSDPYDGLASFAQTWGVTLITVHHEIVSDENDGKFSADTLVDVFSYHPGSSFDFIQFASKGNRQLTSLDELVAKLESMLEQ